MNFILIGKGRWGIKLYDNLKKIGNVKKVIRRKDNYKKVAINNIDWVVIASPNQFHYKQVKYFLSQKVNVFCEKPLTLSHKSARELIEISKINKTKLYISDIEIFKNKIISIKKNNYIIRSKISNYNFKETLFNLAYHDLYILSSFLHDKKKLKIEIIKKKKKVYIFRIFQNSKTFNFSYHLNKKPTHTINNIIYSSKKNYIDKMLSKVFSNNVIFNSNHRRSLKAIYFIERILEKKVL